MQKWLQKTHCMKTKTSISTKPHIHTLLLFPDMNPLRPVYLAVLAAAYTLNCANAANGNDADPMELEISQNIESPAVPRKLHKAITANIKANRDKLTKNGYSVKVIRNGEAMEITFPCVELFAPNDSVLLPEKLKGLLPYLHQPQLYKMLVAVHSDNTGSREYADALTESRVSAIADYLIQASGGNDDILLVPYAQGMDEPLTSNDRRENRRKNRRVEIYLIPDKPLFKRLK